MDRSRSVASRLEARRTSSRAEFYEGKRLTRGHETLRPGLHKPWARTLPSGTRTHTPPKQPFASKNCPASCRTRSEQTPAPIRMVHSVVRWIAGPGPVVECSAHQRFGRARAQRTKTTAKAACTSMQIARAET